MILNRQREVRVAQPALELFLRRVRRHLNLGDAQVTICLVSDAEIARMNESFRKKRGPTDVLSFPAVQRRRPLPLPTRPTRKAGVGAVGRGRRLVTALANPGRRQKGASREIRWRRTRLNHPDWIAKSANKRQPLPSESNFLGDIAISPSTARRNAKKFGRTLHNELQILVIHGVLHLLGFDHEKDDGQMDKVEQRLRRRLGLA